MNTTDRFFVLKYCAMQEIFFINSVEHFSYIGIFIFAIFSGYIVPIPEEIILLIVGYMVSVGFIHFIPAMIVLIVAFVIGDNILYRLTIKNNKHVTKFIHEVLSLKFISKNRDFLEKHINLTIFLTRFIPFLRFVGPVFAGYVKAKRKSFILFNTLSIVIFTPFLMWVGYFFHDYFDEISIQLVKVRHIGVISLWIILGLIITRIVDYLFKKNI